MVLLGLAKSFSWVLFSSMIVYRTTDRIPVKIGDVTIWICPLSAGQYAEVVSLTKYKGGREIPDPGAMAILTLRYCVKSVDGLGDVKYADGTDFLLEFDESGNLTEDSLSVLIQVLGSDKLTLLASQVAVKGIGDHKIPGVKIDLKNAVTAKKKKTA